MATPQEKRFARLLLARKLLTAEQLEQCREFQANKRDQGSSMPLWDCCVLQNVLQQEEAEKLQVEAGDLTVDRLGDFVLVRKLGEGGMGAVYLGIGPEKRRAAIKVLAPHLANQRSLLTRFFREGQASIKLQHENLVRGYDIGEDSGYYYFAMEYIDGRSLGDIIEQGGVLPVDRASDTVLGVSEALAYAHENGLIHRDIKPENIMLTREGVPKLADLGLARQMDSEMTALTRTGTAMGTPYYMAPEQATDAKRADERSDLYSLGATWYHMVTGAVPFEGETSFEVFQKHMKEPLRPPEAVRKGIPRQVSMTIQRLMAKEPDQRVQSAGELCELIRNECLGTRDIRSELGLQERRSEEGLWNMKIQVGGRVEKRRLSLIEIRQRIKKGHVTRDTPARRAGERGAYMPAGSFRELAPEFQSDYAVSAKTVVDRDAPHTRQELHELVSGFDGARRSYRRKKKLKKMLPGLLKLAVVAAVGVLIYLFRAPIWGLISGLIGKFTG